MTLHTEVPTDATRTLLALISALVKWQGAKLTHRTYLHCYTLTLKDQREIKETIPVTTASKRIKYPGINLPMRQKTFTLKTVSN